MPNRACVSRSLASGGFLSRSRNVVLLGPPGTGKTHLATGLGVVAAPPRAPGAVRQRHRWVTRLTDATAPAGYPKSWLGCGATG